MTAAIDDGAPAGALRAVELLLATEDSASLATAVGGLASYRAVARAATEGGRRDALPAS